MDCLIDFGGLTIALALLLQPMLSCFTQAIKSSTILDDTINLDYDGEDGSSYQAASHSRNQKKFPQESHKEIKQRREGLLVRLRDSLTKISLQEADLDIFRATYLRLKRYRLDCAEAFCIEWCICCVCTKRDSIKKYKTGLDSVKRRLDLSKIIRTSVDLEILKKLYLLPRQRQLFKK